MPFAIVNDTLISGGTPYEDLSPRSIHVRNAMLLITIGAPLCGSAVVWMFSERGLSIQDTWTFPRLSIAWFLSVGLAGFTTFFEYGYTDRFVFMIEVFHTQVDVLITSLLLHLTPRKALALSGLWGLILYSIVLFSPTMTAVYLSTSILGGADDLLIFLLFFNAREWVYAIGALGHIVGSIIVYVNFILPVSVILYNSIIFFSLWNFIGFTLAAIVYNSVTEEEEQNGRIMLVYEDIESESRNPLNKSVISRRTFIILMAVSLGASTSISLLCYALA